jgi:hypothetical protein
MQWVAPAALLDPISHVAANPDLVLLSGRPVFHVATNPDSVELLSEAKSTCKYPVDDV